MTLPPMPPPDPLGGMPGGDPLGPIPGSDPPSGDEGVSVPEQRAPRPDPEPIPGEAGDSRPPDERIPAPAPAAMPGSQPTPAPRPGEVRRQKNLRNGIVALGLVVAAALCFAAVSVVSLLGVSTNGSVTTGEEPAAPPQPEAKLSAEEHYGAEFELAKEIAGSPVLDRVDAWDHVDCEGIVAKDALDTALPDGGCGYAVEGAYEREDLDVLVSQYILVFDDAENAAATAKDFDPDSLAEDVSFSGEAGGGARAGLVEAVDEYVVVTVGELGSQDDAEEASDVIGFFHVENINVLRFT